MSQNLFRRFNGTEQHVETEKDQIDVSHGDRDLARDYQTAVQHVIERLEQREFAFFELLTVSPTNDDLFKRHPVSSAILFQPKSCKPATDR